MPQREVQLYQVELGVLLQLRSASACLSRTLPLNPVLVQVNVGCGSPRGLCTCCSHAWNPPFHPLCLAPSSSSFSSPILRFERLGVLDCTVIGQPRVGIS